MKDVVRVAAAQIEIKPLDPEVNLAKHWEAVNRVTGDSPVDLVVFPELANSGYVRGMEKGDFATFSRQYLKVAERIPGPIRTVLLNCRGSIMFILALVSWRQVLIFHQRFTIQRC